ncbi:MAG TPA: bifunctional 2-C-methyl-D-erythritol 4-phosphate cytidylyltransferase/2-C-methyl-D-erythritol 2,4-cyclodiphosphate synthase [Caulobacteraceae bacterium]
MTFAAIIVAAGAGVRAGEGPAKQWRRLGGRPLLLWSVEAMLEAGAAPLVIVIAKGEEARARKALAGHDGWTLAVGGPTRGQSVVSGLAALEGCEEPLVLIHDAARPFLETRHVDALLARMGAADGAILVLPVADTMKRSAPSGVTTLPREGLWRAQTPQAFRLDALRAAYEAWNGPAAPTDDAAVIEAAGGHVVLAPGDPMLMKLTFPEDFAMAERLAAGARAIRIGQGFDAHRFGAGDSLWLCGVKIAHTHSLLGHSDADAGLHALTDALLGAIGEGDIGDHFPPDDPQWKGVASDRFLRHAAGLIAARGGRIVNVDITLVCETPRIKPHRQSMRAHLSELLELPLASVSVKATTTEGMGFLGRREGIVAQAVAAVELPEK